MRERAVAALAAGLAGVAALTGCGATTSSDATTSGHAVRLATAASGPLRLSGGWASAPDDAAPAGTATTKTAAMGSMPGMSTTPSRTTGAAAMSAAYATLRDTGDRADALVAASSPAARSITLHTTVRTGGGSAGTMAATARIVVPAHGTVRLRPGGYHLMVTGLRHALHPGDRLPIRLEFASGRRLTVSLPVIALTDRPGS